MPGFEKRPAREIRDTLRTRARNMRRRSTFPEILLWSRLRGDQILGLRFRRQHRVGSYIIDFFCPKLDLAIELDGDSHVEREEYDAVRDRYAAIRGVTVLRFSNDDVLKHLDAVVRSILHECERLLNERLRPSPRPSP